MLSKLREQTIKNIKKLQKISLYKMFATETSGANKKTHQKIVKISLYKLFAPPVGGANKKQYQKNIKIRNNYHFIKCLLTLPGEQTKNIILVFESKKQYKE